MTDYTERVKALRSASAVSTSWEKLMLDAAAAIEGLVESVHIRDKHLDELNHYIWKLEAEVGKLKDELYKKIPRKVDDGKFEALEPKRGEIVRCKDCKWYSIYEAKKDGSPDKRYSPSVCLREIYAKRRDTDWFCADGERRVQE